MCVYESINKIKGFIETQLLLAYFAFIYSFFHEAFWVSPGPQMAPDDLWQSRGEDVLSETKIRALHKQ